MPLFSYIRSMGKLYFPIFGAFTVCNIGFRSAQRKLRPNSECTAERLWLD